MKTLTPGHKYELGQFEPIPARKPLKGLAMEAYEVSLLIEKLPPGEDQTKAVTASSALMQKLLELEYGNQTIQFIEKASVEGQPGLLETVNNGTTNEEVLKMLIDRMQFLYSKFPSEETFCSIGHLKSALYAQQSRTFERQQRGVEGKHLK